MGLRDFTWVDVLETNAMLRSRRTAFAFDGERISHGEALDRARRLAVGLAARGVGTGDRVAFLSQNRIEMLDALGAAALLGAILLPVNWRLGAEEVAAILADGAPRVVIAEAEFAPALEAARKLLAAGTAWFALGEAAAPCEPYAALLADGEPPATDIVSSAPLLIIHTAAVEGRPRGAVLSHANLLAHNQQLAAAWGLGEDDAALAILPLFHISGLGLVMAAIQAGATSLVMRRFEAEEAVRLVAEEEATVMCEFAPILEQMLDAADRTGVSLASLRAVWGLDSPQTIARFEAACSDATFWSGYGQSETSAYVSFSPHRERPGSAGRPVSLARLAILGEDDVPVPAGTVGEIAVRGPLVFQGYWNMPDETAWTFRGGWHHTGDMGRFDEDGYLVYAGRSPAKELIKTGGENVYPAEVEAALRAHEAIAEAVVIGVPDPRWGEAVRAICERRPGATVDEASLVAFVGERIARYKRPKSVVFVEGLLRGDDGRPDRAAIKAAYGA